MSDFLPQGYELPNKGNGYMKLAQGENRFRILEKPVFGQEFWVNKQPKRFRMDQDIPVGEIEDMKTLKHFWAMKVYNYDIKRVQIFEITQKTILGSILALIKNKKYGSPLNYNLSITREGEGMDTEYTILPEPVDPEEEKLIAEVKKGMPKIDLEALFKSEDPFGSVKASKPQVEEESEDIDPNEIPF